MYRKGGLLASFLLPYLVTFSDSLLTSHVSYESLSNRLKLKSHIRRSYLALMGIVGGRSSSDESMPDNNTSHGGGNKA